MTEELSVDDRAASRARVLTEPTLPILLLALVAMVRREYLPDIGLVAATAVLVVVDSRRWATGTAPVRLRGSTVRPAAGVGAGAIALVMASLPHGAGGWLDVAFAVVGLLVLRQVWSPGAGSAPGVAAAAVPRRWWLWPILGVALALVELFSFLHQSAPMVDNPRHPTLSTVVEPHLVEWPVRVLVLWIWLLGCWWLVRRVRAWSPR